MKFVERALRRRPRARSLPLFPALLLVPALAVADGPVASSTFAGAEDPLSENGAWAPLTSLSASGGRFQKNNGAFPDRFSPEHAGARTAAPVPADHYSEIVVGHLGTQPVNNNVGPIVRVQASGPTIDSHYLWWAGPTNGVNNLYRIDANGTSFSASTVLPTSAAADGDRLRLIARGPVIYGIKNGVRAFIYNTGPDSIKLSGGTAGMLAFVTGPALTDASIASWSGGAAPASSGTRDSSNFAGVENPLDEGDRWYPLPGYAGFRKASGLAIGLNGGHNASGVWSIAPPATQFSEVTLGTVSSGGGGPMVRIDRTNSGQTGWLLFLWADNPSGSGIYKVNPDGSFTFLRAFTPTIVAGDKWRLTAGGNTLEVTQNGISQFTFTTDGSYPSGDVGIEALGPAFAFTGWQGGAVAQPPTIASFAPTSGPVGTSVTISGSGFTGATAVALNGTGASFTVTSDTAVQATVPAGATTGPLSVTTPGGTATSTSSFTVVNPPAIASFAPTSGPVGTSVTISGSNFTGATAVAFNGVSAAFAVTSDTSIQATVPAGATTGPLSATTSAGTATSTGSFTVRQTLTVAKAGTGAGSVTSSSNPPSASQIACGATCSATYDSGTVVTLTAAPAAGSTFTSWSGCDAVSGPTCTVTMSAARTVTASFAVQRFKLTVTKSSPLGIGNGTVTSTSNPASSTQISCGSTCSASFDCGTVVTLNVTPGLLSIFTGWSGCDAASGTTCTVTMSSARSVTANFLP